MNLHVAIFYSPRRDETFPPKFYFFSTWRAFLAYVENSYSPRGEFRFPP